MRKESLQRRRRRRKACVSVLPVHCLPRSGLKMGAEAGAVRAITERFATDDGGVATCDRAFAVPVKLACVGVKFARLVTCAPRRDASVTRIDPRLEPAASRCCCECGSGQDYEACPHDPRMVRSYAAREAIATSTGQDDSSAGIGSCIRLCSSYAFVYKKRHRADSPGILSANIDV